MIFNNLAVFKQNTSNLFSLVPTNKYSFKKQFLDFFKSENIATGLQELDLIEKEPINNLPSKKSISTIFGESYCMQQRVNQ